MSIIEAELESETEVRNRPQKFLCVGLACLDIIQVVSSYPLEDSDQRCLEQHLQRGGNASNNCTVLSLLGSKCEFLGTLSKNFLTNFITDDFKHHGIEFNNCISHENCDIPLSTVIINALNGSRTIIHSNKNLPELTAKEFRERIKLGSYNWIHFEGRNPQQVALMLEWIDSCKCHLVRGLEQIKVSIELEKKKSEMLLPLADIVFIGRDFALSQGLNSMEETIECLRHKTKPKATIIVPWGGDGAMARGADGEIVCSSAFPPSETIDTLGAGDTFCAGVIFCLSSGKSLLDSITFGCKLAGAKVGMVGYKDLKEIGQLLKQEFHLVHSSN